MQPTHNERFERGERVSFTYSDMQKREGRIISLDKYFITIETNQGEKFTTYGPLVKNYE